MSVVRALFRRGRAARDRMLLALVALFFCTAPTPGDIGGCGQRAAPLDPEVFFASKQALDCGACERCQLSSAACQTACEGPPETSFPERCEPLVHDGEACLRALQYAGCDDYAEYMSDRAPSVPTECNFCPEPAP